MLEPAFVTTIPEDLAEGTLYISVEYGIMMHRCACGCGHAVSTPISPTDWQLSYDGEAVTVKPSIGNWDYPCRSHYWIRGNRIVWAEDWTDAQVQATRRASRRQPPIETPVSGAAASPTRRNRKSWWKKILRRV